MPAAAASAVRSELTEIAHLARVCGKGGQRLERAPVQRRQHIRVPRQCAAQRDGTCGATRRKPVQESLRRRVWPCKEQRLRSQLLKL